MIETVCAAGLWKVNADAHQLESAILNIAINARDAMPSGGTLTISTHHADLDGRVLSALPEYILALGATDFGYNFATVLRRGWKP